MPVLVSDAPQLAPVRAANTDGVNLDSFTYESWCHALDGVWMTAIGWSASEYNEDTLDVRRLVTVKRVICSLQGEIQAFSSTIDVWSLVDGTSNRYF